MIPKTTEELDQLLGTMQSKGASKQEMQIVFNAYKKQQEEIKSASSTVMRTKEFADKAVAESKLRDVSPTVARTMDVAEGAQIAQEQRPILEEAINTTSKTPINEQSTEEAEFYLGKDVKVPLPFKDPVTEVDVEEAVDSQSGLQKTAEAFKGGVSKTGGGLKDVAQGVVDPSLSPEEAFQKTSGGLGNVVGGTFETIFSPVSGILSSVPGGEEVGKILNSPFALVEFGIKKAYEKAGYDTESVDFQSSILNPIMQAVNVGSTIAAPTVAKASQQIYKGTKGKIKDIQEGRIEKVKQAELPIIQEMVSPAVKGKEVKNIIEQGRITKGKESFLLGKRPDTISHSAKTIKSAETVQKLIPDAADLDEYTLVTKINDTVKTLSENLKPQLKKVEISPETYKQAVAKWELLKKKQQKQPDFEAYPGSKRAQKNFEAYLGAIKQPKQGKQGKFRRKNLDDFWNSRKEYDDTISDRVKKADNNSSSTDQFQKEMWLENRRILNDFLIQESKKLDIETQQTFGELNQLYNAKENVIQKSKIDLKGKEGPLSKGNLIKGGLGVAGTLIGYEGLKSLIGD